MKNEDLDKLLRFDALDTAEKMTGKHSATDKGTVEVGMALMQINAAAKDAALTERGDTTFSNTLERYTAIITGYGFELALRLPFKSYFDDFTEPETYFIYAHRDGLLLSFDTYHSEKVNGSKVYYNWKPHDWESRKWWCTCTSSGGAHKTENVWIGDHDGREALLFNLDRLRKHGDFLAPWIEQPFLWLLHYTDSKTDGYDYKAIARERIAMLPPWVQEMIGAPERY